MNRRRGLTEPRREAASEHWLLAGHYDPGFVCAVEESLDELGRLEANWDGYGAPPIDQGIISAARKFVRALPPDLAYRPRVVPMSAGNLQFEWQHGSKSLELEFESPGTVRFLQWHPEAAVSEESTFRADDIEKAVDLIQWFMSGTCV